MNPAVPPEQQIHFLQQLQRLLNDGSFVATYKFALLHAIADLAVLHGNDSGGELRLGTREIAEEIIELYWRQALPFPAGGTGTALVLRQNTGRQAAILVKILQAQESCGTSLVRYRRRRSEWERLVREVDQVVREMPLWRLQTVGNERLSFLYENVDTGNEITLKPGVAFCLRAFYPLILDLVRGVWLRHVRTYNTAALGESSELGAFLFGTGRGSLAVYQPILVEVQNGTCFYCRSALHGAGEVDHFIPWTRYPVDLGHNFVLAHAGCNRSKSDHLAAEGHLEHWLSRNEAFSGVLASAFDAAGAAYSVAASTQIGRWAYAHTSRIGGQVWEKGNLLRPLSPHWETLFLSSNTLVRSAW
ncbi:MAG TPA: HNH endonuclease signature motif containing protein [Longimicrobium sp.]|jgi:5-methylcytosine-specific restriction endonuclease McrA